MRDMRNACIILENLKGRDHLGNLGIAAMVMLIWILGK
jgi:hypothetical protein